MSHFPIKQLVVHCSATPASMDIGAKWIDREHRLNRKFLQIGYHWVIKRDGTLEAGRPESIPGAHAEGHNTGSLGICLVGGVKADGKTPEANFTDAQYATLYQVLQDKLKAWPGAEVLGHRDFPNVAKACPCFDVRSWFQSYTP